MAIDPRFVHVNIVARNWKKLAHFYEHILGCTPLPPERNLEGPLLDAGTGVRGARIRGIHLRLPGCGVSGPTLEIFQYNLRKKQPEKAINSLGIVHMAFVVDDIEAARNAVIDAGGGVVGEVVTLEVPGAGTVTFVYLTDPEGNIIELQRWAVE